MMNTKKVINLHIVSIALLFLATTVFFSEPNIYGYILFQTFFFLTVSSFCYYLTKLFKLTQHKNQSIFLSGQLIFYLVLLFIIQYYLIYSYNDKYTFDIFFIVSAFLSLLIFFLLFTIYYILNKK